jgi:lysophospholipase L1-like esterase
MDLGKGDGRDVITIGDSWMRFLLTGIETGLVKASGQRYRQYGVLGTKLLDGVIPGQYRSAKRDDADIKTVVMTGGGNDVIQSTLIEASCRDGTQLCEQQLNEIRQALAELWAQMSKDGVQDVIHVMYSKSAASAVKNRDAHNAKLAETCAAVSPPLRCHMLNTDMLIRALDLRLDGIHPDDAGYDRIGKAVFDLMVEKGMRR